VAITPTETLSLIKNIEDLRPLLTARQKQLDFEQEILTILADGVIDELDSKSVRLLKKVFPDLIGKLTQIYQSVIWMYDHHKEAS
jgi:hypothetical protein